MKHLISLYILFFITPVQELLPYDAAKVSTDRELNFYMTDKRGIKYKGFVYYVESDLNTVTAYKKNGGIKWRSDVSEIIKCRIGSPEIRFIKIEKDRLSIIYAKHDFGELNLKTGKVTHLGSD